MINDVDNEDLLLEEILDEEIKLRNVSTNQYVFVSKDIYGNNPFGAFDNVVEARDDNDNNGRTKFRLQRTPSGNFRLLNTATQMYLFVSGDKLGIPPDNVVEARNDNDNNGRTRFRLQRTPSGNFRFFNVNTQKYLFVSGDKYGIPPGDNVIEAHSDGNDPRNRFHIERQIHIERQTYSNVRLSLAAVFLAAAFLLPLDQSSSLFLRSIFVLIGVAIIGNEVGNLANAANGALGAVENAANTANDRVRNFPCAIM